MQRDSYWLNSDQLVPLHRTEGGFCYSIISPRGSSCGKVHNLASRYRHNRLIKMHAQPAPQFFHDVWQRVKNRTGFWKQLFSVTILACYFYILMEWIFFATMPSFMDILSLSKKLEIYLLSSLGFAFFSLVVLAGFILLDTLAIGLHVSKLAAYVGILLPTFILSALALQLVDNFTYSLFKFGISTATGAIRAAYAGLFVLLCGWFYFQMLKIFELRGSGAPRQKSVTLQFFAAAGLLVVSLGLALIRLDYGKLSAADPSAQAKATTQLPNIILLGSDGLDAQHLSAYGYSRKTTPQLARLADTSLVADNAFTNAGNTAGSVISILTSKLPTQTRVLYPPNILRGVDAYQHLPGILNDLEYTVVEYGVQYYVDAYTYNLQNGFDMVNNRYLSVGKLGELGQKLGYDQPVYFLSRVIWRISDRLLSIFFIKTIENPFEIVTEPVPQTSDIDKIHQLLNYLDEASAPVFAHVHLLGTHGGFYQPPDQLYSIGKNQFDPWMDDFYDDTLRAYDTYVGEVVGHLKESGQFDNTILIIYTDHNRQFKVNGRIPLIIHFPGDEYAGRLSQNVENLDIAPTILDYLGLPIPDWMGGTSLLNGGSSEQRLIFSAGTDETKPNADRVEFIDSDLDQPPFYQFSYITVIDCQRWYSFDLTTFVWSTGEVRGYVNACSPTQMLGWDEIEQAVLSRLAADGFDISSIP